MRSFVVVTLVSDASAVGVGQWGIVSSGIYPGGAFVY
jgi:hypothetical protein